MWSSKEKPQMRSWKHGKKENEGCAWLGFLNSVSHNHYDYYENSTRHGKLFYPRSVRRQRFTGLANSTSPDTIASPPFLATDL